MGNQSSSEYNPEEHGQAGRELFDSYVADDDDDQSKFGDLSNKTVAITGTSAGSIGFHVAEIALRKNAKILMLCNRDSSSAKKGYEELLKIAKECGSKTDIKTVTCDLQDLASVKQAGGKINEIIAKDNGLDVLVCNAGVMAMKDVRTKDGFDVQMQTNQLSHFLLASIVWPSIVKAAKTRGAARLVTHSSSSRYSPSSNLEKDFFMKCEAGTLGGDMYPMPLQLLKLTGGNWQRYHQTKLANANFAMALHDKLQASGDETLKKIQASSADPGLATSNLQVTTINDGGMPNWLAKLLTKQGQSPADGSLPVGMAAFGKDTKSGSFFQPEKDFLGSPVATVEEGVSTQKKGDEALVVSPENKENVWKWCEEALEIKFSIE